MKRAILAALSLVIGVGQVGCERESAIPGAPPGSTWSYSAQMYTAQITQTDLLFVVSNAPTMRAKQQLLIDAIPGMVRRLVWPNCVDVLGNVTERIGTCPQGTSLEFDPWRDLHVGVISTSLGGHGSPACPRDEEGKDDRALFIPKVRSGVPDPDGTGILSWKGGSLEELEEFISNLQAHIEAVGTSGCEAPAPLEAWYRALVDPSPPEEIVVGAEGLAEARRSSEGEILLDEDVLAQRQEFLRPVGLVSIVVVSDQDDCSLMDGGVAYENAGLGHRLLDVARPMERPTAACALSPNDECCFACSKAATAPEECDVSACEGELALAPELDRPSVRCVDTKRRFGLDFAYPVQRYIDGLSRSQVVDDDSGEFVDNPLLRGSGRFAGVARDPGLIFFIGILGVPWQDVVTAESFFEPSRLRLRTSAELAVRDVSVGGPLFSRWEVMLGQQGTPPLDPFLIPSIQPREIGLTNPISGDSIVAPDSTNPLANNINGHEADHSIALPELYADGGPANDRLQASCIFPLEEPIVCEPNDPTCLCSGEPSRNSAACSPVAGGTAGTTQYFAEAYPAPRILQVLQGFGYNGTVAPICPKFVTGEVTDPAFGFNPALDVLTDRLAEHRGQRCFPRELAIDDEGQVPCVVVEAWPKEGFPYEYLDEEEEPSDPCAMEGRSEVNPLTRNYIETKLREAGRCGGTSEVSCEDYRLCLVDQLQGDAARRCLTDPDVEDSGPPGFCYVDPNQTNADGEFVAGGGMDGGNPIVRNCPASERRLLRFVGENTPRANTVTFIACQMLDLSSTSAPGPEDFARMLPFIESERGTSEIPPDPDPP